MLYLEARDSFKRYGKLLKKGTDLSFGKMRGICDMLYQIKEDHHLLYKRVVDPRKGKFERAEKFLPDDYDLAFINNVGLLFHKVMVARELKYVLEHYVENSIVFKRNKDHFESQIKLIDELFDEGIEVLKSLIVRNNGNLLLLSLLLENPDMIKKHFGKSADNLIKQFSNGKGLSEVYFSVGKYYVECGHKDRAKKMLRTALKNNAKHVKAKELMSEL